MATVGSRSLIRESRTFFPEREREDLLTFAKVLNGLDASPGREGQAKLIGPDGTEFPIPVELFGVLEQAARTLALGDGITIMPTAAKLTTQEAADFLGVSRPTLVKFLTQGEIPFETVGRHRRVLLRDVVAFQSRTRDARRAALAELARDTAAQPVRSGVPTTRRHGATSG